MKRLLRFAILHDDETLDSYVERLAIANYYKPTTILKKTIFDGKRDEQFLRPRYLETLSNLSRLTNIPVVTLHAATAHRFADILTPPDIKSEYFPSGLAKFVYPVGIRTHQDYQYCPRCLEENPYHRLIWLPTAVSTCLEHRCLLVAGCPHCHSKLHINAIVIDRCSFCHGRLSYIDTVDLSQDALGLTAQQAIQHWLGFAEMPNINLPPAAPVALYRFLNGLRYVLAQVSHHWPYLHKPNGIHLLRFDAQNNRMSRPESYVAYATAFKALTDWPHGFYAFLDAYRVRKSFDGNFQHEMKVLYRHWMQERWRGKLFDFIQEAFDNYIIDRYRDSLLIMQSERYIESPKLAARFYYIHVAEAARQLDTKTTTIHQLASIGILEKHETERLLVVRSDVQRLQERWERGISVKETANRLGVTQKTVIELAQRDFITTIRQPIPNINQTQLIDEASANEYQQKLQDVVIFERPSGYGYDFSQTMYQLYFRPKYDVIAILQRIIDGQLTAYLDLSQPFSIHKFIFLKHEIDDLAQL